LPQLNPANEGDKEVGRGCKQFLSGQVDQKFPGLSVDHPHQTLSMDHFTYAAEYMQILPHLFTVCH